MAPFAKLAVVAALVIAYAAGDRRSPQTDADGECEDGGVGEETCAAKKTWVCEADLVLTASRVVVVADVHGDGVQLTKALRTANLVNADGQTWIGGSAVLVQTGDIMDRGPDSYDILVRLRDLAKQARLAGGCVVQLLGNHELLNMAGDFTYADPQETAGFGGTLGRHEKLGLGHWLGDRLRSLPLAARVVQHAPDGTNFTTIMSHAGVGHWIAEQSSLAHMNQVMREAFRSATERDIARLSHTSRILLGQGPLWTRAFAEHDETRVCALLDRTLAAMDAQRMIVGHTVQMTGRPAVRCSGRLVLADTGMSSFYGGGVSLVQLEPEAESPISLY